jgi:hypothetical protein
MPASAFLSSDPDWPIRQAAFQRLAELTRLYGAVLPWEVVTQGFSFRGELIYFATRAQGIFRPRQMRGGALSIKTTIPRQGRTARYDDIASEDGAFFYRFKGDDPENHSNQLLAQAQELKAPLIYFYGVGPGMYRPIWPAYISRFDASALTCEVVADEAQSVEAPGTALHDATADRIRRGYITPRSASTRRPSGCTSSMPTSIAAPSAACLAPSSFRPRTSSRTGTNVASQRCPMGWRCATSTMERSTRICLASGRMGALNSPAHCERHVTAPRWSTP